MSDTCGETRTLITKVKYSGNKKNGYMNAMNDDEYESNSKTRALIMLSTTDC